MRITLFCISGGVNTEPDDVRDSGSVRIIPRSWIESEVTWASADASNPWTNKGGDFEPEVVVTVPFVESPGWEEYNLTSAVKEFVKNPSSNFGVIIASVTDYKDIQDQKSPDRLYIASDYTDSIALRPKMTITTTTGIINLATTKVFNNNIILNITSEGVKFYIPFNKNYKVSISDIKGRQLFSFSGNNEGWHQISSLKLSTGMHIISINTEGKIAFRKFLFVN